MKKSLEKKQIVNLNLLKIAKLKRKIMDISSRNNTGNKDLSLSIKNCWSDVSDAYKAVFTLMNVNRRF